MSLLNPQHRALLIGINDYEAAPLAGCVNDVLDVAALVEPLGYKVRTLLDGQATKAAIRACIAADLEALRFGDQYLLWYSGHGTKVPDRNGDEADRWDEAWCPVDYARPGGLYVDDEIYDDLNRRRHGVRVRIGSDSCNAGGVARLGALPKPVYRSWASADPAEVVLPKYLPPATVLRGEALDRALRMEEAGVTAKGTPRAGAILLAGCQPWQVSYDAYFGGRPNGAFTRAAIDAYRPGMTVAAWRDAIPLPSGRFDQAPHLTATRYQAGRSAL